jgi:hypothetical protein
MVISFLVIVVVVLIIVVSSAGRSSIDVFFQAVTLGSPSDMLNPIAESRR